MWEALNYTDETPAWLRVYAERRIDALSQETLYGGFVSMWEHPDGMERRPTADAYLSRRRCPVLAIHSTRRMSAHEQGTFRDPRSRAVDWPGAGHWVEVERPTEFADTLVDWVGEVLGPAGTGPPGPAGQVATG